jgi:hypothetical protein
VRVLSAPKGRYPMKAGCEAARAARKAWRRSMPSIG